MTTTKLALSFLCLYFTGASLGKAQSFGDFDYELINGDAEVRITEYTGSGVSHVTVPDSIDGKLVTEIGANAFEFASNPRGGTNNGFDTISLPSNLKTIREQAFTAAILTAIVIPDSVTVIESGAFESCPNLASVTLSDNLAEISADLFADCNSLLSIVIPESVLTIGDGAFSSCNALNSITLSSQLQTIGISAFDSCTSLSSIVLPETLTTIGNTAFRTTGLVSVVIPAAVDSIGINAFGNCDALTGITVDAANLSYSSENGILFDKTKTLLMRYPPTKAGEYVVPASVTDISDSAFSESVLLTEVTLPSAMNTIADNAFWSCTLLQTVKMPDTLTTLGQRAFGGCSSLKRMELPAGITKVPFNCFGACTGLEYLTIPEGVTSIEQFAFNLCTNLKRIVFPTTLTTMEATPFSNSGDLIPIFLGEAPSIPTNGSEVFQEMDGIIVYHLSSATTFGATFDGKTTQVLDAASYQPASGWLIENGLSFDTDLSQDLNSDGVSLLLAYALDLNPNDNLAGELPTPEFGPSMANFNYFAAAEGVSYDVQISEDLADWDTIEANYSAIDGRGFRTASLDTSGYDRIFIRLEVVD